MQISECQITVTSLKTGARGYSLQPCSFASQPVSLGQGCGVAELPIQFYQEQGPDSCVSSLVLGFMFDTMEILSPVQVTDCLSSNSRPRRIDKEVQVSPMAR
jgi:hypothetical protein